MSAQLSLFAAKSQPHVRGWIARKANERAPIMARLAQLQRELAQTKH